jgi:hypothetical protein
MPELPRMLNLDFGVGSFSFETFPAGPENDANWERSIRALLESLPSVHDIEITGVESFTPPEGAPADWESDGILFTPHPDSGKVSFWVTIPARTQRDITERTGGGYNYGSAEDFYVVTYYRTFPVSYVFIARENAPTYEGSQAVVIVREFLRHETRRHLTADSIEFSFVEPSPLYCDFALVASTEPMDQPFRLERFPRQGYDDFRITYDAARYDSPYSAIPAFARDLSNELGYFYESVRIRLRRMKASNDLRDRTARLMAMTVEKKIIAGIPRFFKSRGLIRDLSLDLIIADYEFRQEVQTQQDEAQQLVERSSGLFQKDIDREVDSAFQAELDNMNNIVQLIASRQNRGVDITVLMMTSLLGGIIGSIVTFVFTAVH